MTVVINYMVIAFLKSVSIFNDREDILFAISNFNSWILDMGFGQLTSINVAWF